MKHVTVAIIGGGSAGLSAAVTLKKNGIEDIVVLEKDIEPGGILQQCIHNGFGLQTFREQLSGPAYAERYIDEAEKLGVTVKLGTTVISMSPERIIEYVNPEEGYVHMSADAIILAVGCYERSRGAVEIPGERPAGVYTAGQAQRYLNMDGLLVGHKVFILGSGDIGLIMARRMTLEGAEVLGVAEVMPYSSGLPRNIKQCLEDFNIPLFLSHTVTHIYGKDRVNRVEISQVDENRKPIPGTEKYYDVDTLLLSVGLIPENHLADEAGIRMNPRTRGPVVDDRYMTSIPGIFACGNGLHVHDLVDFVSMESAWAAEGVIHYLNHPEPAVSSVEVMTGKGIGYTVPSVLHPDEAHKTEIFFRVTQPMDAGEIVIRSNEKILYSRKKKKLMPSTMERVALKEDVIAGLSEPVIVEVREIQ